MLVLHIHPSSVGTPNITDHFSDQHFPTLAKVGGGGSADGERQITGLCFRICKNRFSDDVELINVSHTLRQFFNILNSVYI